MYLVLQGTTDLFEGQTAHFEAQVEPLHDPNLRIEFYHNGKPLPSASRFHVTFDFGYVALDITHVVPEDAGEYTVKAINNLGQCTSSINLRVQGMPYRNSVTQLRPYCKFWGFPCSIIEVSRPPHTTGGCPQLPRWVWRLFLAFIYQTNILVSLHLSPMFGIHFTFPNQWRWMDHVPLEQLETLIQWHSSITY